MKTDEQLRLEKQAAYESQQRLFEDHVQHFVGLDDVLQKFAQEHSFILEKNALHRPCRALRKGSNPKYAIEILQEGVWSKVAYRDDLPHTVVVAGYLADEKQEFVYQMNQEVAYFLHFSTIQANIHDYLTKALAWIERWTAEVIRREGAQSKHPMAYYREQGGIKIETVE